MVELPVCKPNNTCKQGNGRLAQIDSDEKVSKLCEFLYEHAKTFAAKTAGLYFDSVQHTRTHM